jgi:hypothetical protein
MSEQILRMVESKFGLNHADDLVSPDGIYAREAGNRLDALTAATLTMTQELHDGKTLVVNKADGSTITLPAATGTGAKYKIYVGTTITSVGLVIQVANATDVFEGLILGSDTDGGGATGYTWPTVAASDTITCSGTATGGRKGDYFIIEDVAAGFFSLTGFISQSGGSEATPLSAAV